MKQVSITFPRTNARVAYQWCLNNIGKRKGRSYYGDSFEGGIWTYESCSFDSAVFIFLGLDDKILIEFKLRFG